MLFSKSFRRQILCGQLDIFEQRDNALLDLTNANDGDYASKAQLFSQCVCSVDIPNITQKYHYNHFEDSTFSASVQCWYIPNINQK